MYNEKSVKYLILLISGLLLNPCYSRDIKNIFFKLNSGQPSSGPTGNGISIINISGNNTWVGSNALSRTSDNGLTWTAYTQNDGLGRGGVSAIAVKGDTIWVATLFDTTTQLGRFHAGGGFFHSIDSGQTWKWTPQHVDTRDISEYEPTTTIIENATYDLAITGNAVWSATKGAGLRKTTDMGESWEVVTVDGYPFAPLEHLTHRTFSVLFTGKSLWVGSAGGIHKSLDKGKTWVTFNHQNQQSGISGNFVVAIGYQHWRNKCIIWASTLEAEDEDEYRAISKTEDGGLTWDIFLEGIWTYDFAFDDSVVYACTDNGLYKSLDFGETWAVFPQIYDTEIDERIYNEVVYSAGVGSDEALWVGTGDGLALTTDNGLSWKIFRSFEKPGEGGNPKTYAYPNPFSPLRHNVSGEDGHVRFQYRTEKSTYVTIKIYDFGMNLVKTTVYDKYRPMAGDYADVWDGKNELGDMVANGVYFYKIIFDHDDPLWGKVMVVN